MGKVVRALSVSKDFMPITRGHLKYASELIGTDKLGWFEDGSTMFTEIVLFDASKYSVEDMEELYKPYYQNSRCEDNQWISKYIHLHGWDVQMIFDLDNPSIHGVLNEVYANKNCLVVEYMESAWIPVEGKVGNGVVDLGYSEEFDNLVSEIWVDESRLSERTILCETLPEWRWGDVHSYFHYATNGDKNSGYITVDEQGAVISDDSISRMQSELAKQASKNIRKEAPWILGDI